jgi:ubiquinone/menaquinone biosynthesis C-methylase UbiE
MRDQPMFQEINYLMHKQYRDSKNLDARAALHRRYSTATTRWQPWVFPHLALKPGARVLECGCGPGWLWRENLAQIPPGCHITLTDLSAGMVAEAEAALADAPHEFTFKPVNIESLPFADDEFDVVVANHMLYHVPDLQQALAEVQRVLKGNGRFIAATNGNNHMIELTQIGRQLFAEQKELANSRLNRSEAEMLGFRIENGGEKLAPYFSQVDLVHYEDSLRVTDAAPLVAYTLSTVGTEHITDALVKTLTTYAENIIAADGSIHITKESGIFIARP